MLKGFNDLETKRPDIAVQWHPTKNGELTPEDVTHGSIKKVWWQHVLPDGRVHEWQARIASRTRTNDGAGCPICAGYTIMKGYNDLATVNPTLAMSWHPTKNGDLTPSDVTAHSNKIVWWKCPNCGRDFQTSVAARCGKNKCRACSLRGRKRVRIVETGLVYSSIIEASRANRAYPSNITRSIKYGYRAAGYHWEYVDSEEKET